MLRWVRVSPRREVLHGPGTRIKTVIRFLAIGQHPAGKIAPCPPVLEQKESFNLENVHFSA
ncbi:MULTISPECIES: hypothetical protein [unclassified Pseudomonas]|uniref:hypothetical protein n=1 Tax=unclassified Pseudomonas TaxID=196821 RepID=UPI0015A01C91|nr:MULTISPECIES: hypothetical protein [unclassified Pseudomonas]NWC94532.1 hypothetical protein [Pseudomonas sp. IPO3779]NWD15237.1 hypothetical protein [Pseudomonas sp. IPO3778]